jgi:hypothetical protein
VLAESREPRPGQTSDINGPGDQHVPDEHEAERRNAGVSLLDEIVQMQRGNLGEFLVGGRIERCEIGVRGHLGYVPQVGSTISPVGAAVVHHGRLPCDPLEWYAQDAALQEA